MLTIAIVLFAAAAVFGLVALRAILTNKPASRPVVLTHGAVAAAGLLLVILFSVRSTTTAVPGLSLTLFIIAALGGFVLFALDMQKKPLPKSLAVLHPLIAAAGLVALILFVAGM